jgi:rhodanese-related sulfurtransferase
VCTQARCGRVYFATRLRGRHPQSGEHISKEVGWGLKQKMAQFIEFIGNNWMLASLWLVLFSAFLFYLTKTGAKSVSTQEAVMLINRKDGVVLDIRDKKEFDAGHIVDSIGMPSSKLAGHLTELEKYKSRPVIVVCRMGQHSGDACKTLEGAGFTEVVRLRGGMAEWRGQNLPVIQG